MAVSFKLDDKKLQKKLKLLPKNVAKKALRKSCRAGAKIFATQIKADVPVKTGFLKSQVKVRAGKRSRLYMKVNATTGDPKKAAMNTGEAFYGSFVELLHNGKHAFIRPAFEKSKVKAYRAVIDVLSSEIDKEASK